LNISFLKGRELPAIYYLVIFDIIVGVLVVIGIVGHVFIRDRITSLTKEVERQRLMLSDYAMESALFTAIVEMMEIFGTDMSIEETLHRVTQSIGSFFKNEIIIVQLFGQRFFQEIRGESLNISEDIFDEIATKPYPLLINNVETFPKYKFLKEKGVSSFIIVPLKDKKGELSGAIGIFSKNNRVFSQRDLSLMRSISIPISLILDNVELMEQTRILSITDPLTYLYNRRHFQQFLETIINEANRKNFIVSAAMCDIDNFKFYNDRNGHPAGDKVLREISNIIHQNIKGSDIAARYGGEEFVIIFPKTEKETAARICDTIRKKIQETVFPGEEFQPQGDLTISFGVACFPLDAANPEDLIRKADTALYEAKKQGRNRVVIA